MIIVNWHETNSIIYDGIIIDKLSMAICAKFKFRETLMKFLKDFTMKEDDTVIRTIPIQILFLSRLSSTVQQPCQEGTIQYHPYL